MRWIWNWPCQNFLDKNKWIFLPSRFLLIFGLIAVKLELVCYARQEITNMNIWQIDGAVISMCHKRGQLWNRWELRTNIHTNTKWCCSVIWLYLNELLDTVHMLVCVCELLTNSWLLTKNYAWCFWIIEITPNSSAEIEKNILKIQFKLSWLLLVWVSHNYFCNFTSKSGSNIKLLNAI